MTREQIVAQVSKDKGKPTALKLALVKAAGNGKTS